MLRSHRSLFLRRGRSVEERPCSNAEIRAVKALPVDTQSLMRRCPRARLCQGRQPLSTAETIKRHPSKENSFFLKKKLYNPQLYILADPGYVLCKLLTTLSLT